MSHDTVHTEGSSHFLITSEIVEGTLVRLDEPPAGRSELPETGVVLISHVWGRWQSCRWGWLLSFPEQSLSE